MRDYLKLFEIEYTPDTWVILEVQNDDKTFYKVLGGWSGGYLDGSSWRINSGITEVKEFDDHYKFYGSSGSCYRCVKGMYRLSMATSGVWQELEQKYPDQVRIMPEDTNWLDIDLL